ncbi:MAG: cysteine desulfurase NifS [Candidatus Goldiibacteriota bacterium]
MEKIYYLDNNATTRTEDRVFEAMKPYMTEMYANASGIYSFGQDARKAVEDARETVKDFLGARHAKEIIFTSGGTESDNLALKGAAYAGKSRGRHIITSAIEHHAVLNTVKFLEKQGFEASYVPVDERGIIRIEELKRAIRPDTVLISVMYVNNETGVIQPVEDIARIASEKGILFHTDAVQAGGKIELDMKNSSIDMLSLSAHKFHGPKGTGILYVKKGTALVKQLHGGHHEFNKRAGTENIPGIAGAAKACEIAAEEMKSGKSKKEIKRLRDRLEKGISEKIPEIKINGDTENRVDNTLNVSIKYIEGEGMLMHMDMEGICVSSGSACTSGSLDPSHVLLGMGMSHEDSHGSIRFSLSKYNTDEDVEKVLEVLPAAAERLRNMSPLWKEKEVK